MIDVEAEWEVSEAHAGKAQPSEDLARGQGFVEAASGGREAVEVSDNGRTIMGLERPFPLVFTAVSGDQVMRRLGELTTIQWIAGDRALQDAVISLDVMVSADADIYDLVEVVAEMSGQRAQWKGPRVTFTASGVETGGFADGYLIRSRSVSADLIQLAKERFGVDCSPVGRLSVCVGAAQDIERLREFFGALEGVYGRVEWRIIETTVDVPGVVEALSLQADVVASVVRPGRWLLAATDGRLLPVVVEALQAAQGESCEPVFYAPLHVEPNVLVAALSSGIVGLCAQPIVAGGLVAFGGVGIERDRLRALAMKFDRPAVMSRLLVVVANRLEAQRLGLFVEGWDNMIPSSSPPDSVQLVAALNRAAAWRSLEVTSDGVGDAAIQATDRVEGDLVITDGGTQIRGIEERTVGLSVNLQGIVTERGFRGRVQLTDSFLDNEVTMSATCSGYLSVDVGSVARVCGYERETKSRQIDLEGLSRNKGRESFIVLAAVMSHETAPLDTLRVALGGLNANPR